MTRPDLKHWNNIARHFLGEDFFASFNEGEKKPPLADVYHDNEEVIVLIDLPGVENIHELQMQIDKDQLKIAGSFSTFFSDYEKKLSERQSGGFEKVIPLGALVSNKYTSAQYRKGILELRFPLIKNPKKKINLKKKL